MAKRLTDSNKFKDKWYRKLSPKLKCLWEYLLSECDHAGIFKNLDFDMISFQIGDRISSDDLKNFENRIFYINDETLFIPKFIEFQYGKLNPENRVHASVLRELKKYKIQGVSKGLASPLLGSKDKDKDKNKDKDKEVSSLVLSSLEAEKHNPEKKEEEEQNVYGKYHNVCMSVEQYNKLLGICASQKLLDELVDSLSENIEQGKENPFRAEFPNAHFIRIQKYRKYRLDNPDKFKQETENFNMNEWVQEKTKELQENERLRFLK